MTVLTIVVVSFSLFFDHVRMLLSDPSSRLVLIVSLLFISQLAFACICCINFIDKKIASYEKRGQQ